MSSPSSGPPCMRRGLRERQVTRYTLVKIFPALSQAAAVAHPPGRQRQLRRRCRNDPQRGSYPQHLGHNSGCRGKPAPARIVICIECSLKPAIRKSGRQGACGAAPAHVAAVVPCTCFQNQALRMVPQTWRMCFRTLVRGPHQSLWASSLVFAGIPSPPKSLRASPVQPHQHI